jgi:hypothetical protein
MKQARGDGMNFALRIYRRLAEAFPHEFKLVYGTEMGRVAHCRGWIGGAF